jgi:hypothetical protein
MVWALLKCAVWADAIEAQPTAIKSMDAAAAGEHGWTWPHIEMRSVRATFAIARSLNLSALKMDIVVCIAILQAQRSIFGSWNRHFQVVMYEDYVTLFPQIPQAIRISQCRSMEMALIANIINAKIGSWGLIWSYPYGW